MRPIFTLRSHGAAWLGVAALALATSCIPPRDSVEFNDSADPNNGTSNNGLLDGGRDASANNGTDDVAVPPDSSGGDAASNNVPGEDSGGSMDTGDAGTDPCVPESDDAFCQRQMAACGALSGTDNCGDARTADCGTCQGASCVDNACVCEQNESSAEFCVRLGIECGAASGDDLCGNARTAQCGSCPNGSRCASGTCVEDVCDDLQDNDGDGQSDCSDSDCLNKMCADKPPRTCKANGACEK